MKTIEQVLDFLEEKRKHHQDNVDYWQKELNNPFSDASDRGFNKREVASAQKYVNLYDAIIKFIKED